MAKKKRRKRGKKMTRSQAPKVTAKRKTAIPLMRQDLDALRDILERTAKSPAKAISNHDLAELMWGGYNPDGKVALTEYDRRNRRIRELVRKLRLTGCPIALAMGANGGYFWVTADDPDAVDYLRRTSEMLDQRAETSHKVAAKLVGLGLVEYQAERAAAKIDSEEEQEKQRAALVRFVERVTRNPITRRLFNSVTGERMTRDERAALEAEKAKLDELKSVVRGHVEALRKIIEAA